MKSDYYQLYVQESTIPNSGLGVFARNDLKKGQLLVEYRGLGITNAWAKCFMLEDKMLQVNDRYSIIGRTLSSRINDIVKFDKLSEVEKQQVEDGVFPVHAGLKHNATFQFRHDKGFIHANRDIKAGEELYLDYSYDYWKCFYDQRNNFIGDFYKHWEEYRLIPTPAEYVIGVSDRLKLDVRDNGIFAKSKIDYGEIILECRGKIFNNEQQGRVNLRLRDEYLRLNKLSDMFYQFKAQNNSHINAEVIQLDWKIQCQSTLITPEAIQTAYKDSCGSDGSCCYCSRLETCNSSNQCVCRGDDRGNVQYGKTCLLSSTQFAAVSAQLISGADESSISDFNPVMAYEFLKTTATTSALTLKQLQKIQELVSTSASKTTQTTVIDWYLRVVELMSTRVQELVSIESTAKQSFQMTQIDLVRQLMYKYISLDPLGSPYRFEMPNYSTQISKWKDTTTFQNMTISSVTFASAQCDYKWRSVLVKYKFLISMSDKFIDSFTNSTFIYNSTLTYCMFMNKYGVVYYPPSSEFHYQIAIPPFTYETAVLQSNPNITALGCYQIKLTSSVYKLTYNDQECQYKAISAAVNRTQPYCQCNEPGLTFVQALYKIETYTKQLAIGLMMAVIIII